MTDQYSLSLAVLDDYELKQELKRFEALKRLSRHYGGPSSDWDPYLEEIELEQTRRAVERSSELP